MDELKKKAAEQGKLLTEKQAQADAALKGITQSMQVWCMLQSVSNVQHIYWCLFVKAFLK